MLNMEKMWQGEVEKYFAEVEAAEEYDRLAEAERLDALNEISMAVDMDHPNGGWIEELL